MKMNYCDITVFWDPLFFNLFRKLKRVFLEWKGLPQKQAVEIVDVQCYCEKLNRDSQMYKVDCLLEVHVGDLF